MEDSETRGRERNCSKGTSVGSEGRFEGNEREKTVRAEGGRRGESEKYEKSVRGRRWCTTGKGNGGVLLDESLVSSLKKLVFALFGPRDSIYGAKSSWRA